MKRFSPLPPVTTTSLPKGRQARLQWIPAGDTNNFFVFSFPNIAFFEEKVSQPTGNDAVSILSRNKVVCWGQSGTCSLWGCGVYFTKLTDLEVLYSEGEPINYTVSGNTVHGCNGTLHAAINILPAAILNLPYSVVLYPGDLAILTIPGNENSHTWFLGTGLKATPIPHPVATPTVNIRYIVQAFSAAGCTVSDSVNVLVPANCILALPNAFTQWVGLGNQPKIMKQGLASLNYLRIFNRWGSSVFEAKNIHEEGNGASNGAGQPTEVCVYKVDAKPLPVAVLPNREPSFSFDNPSSTH